MICFCECNLVKDFLILHNLDHLRERFVFEEIDYAALALIGQENAFILVRDLGFNMEDIIIFRAAHKATFLQQ